MDEEQVAGGVFGQKEEEPLNAERSRHDEVEFQDPHKERGGGLYPVAEGKSIVEKKAAEYPGFAADKHRCRWLHDLQIETEKLEHYRLRYEPYATYDENA